MPGHVLDMYLDGCWACRPHNIRVLDRNVAERVLSSRLNGYLGRCWIWIRRILNIANTPRVESILPGLYCTKCILANVELFTLVCIIYTHPVQCYIYIYICLCTLLYNDIGMSQ